MQYRVLAEKLKEAAASVLPVTAIVAVLCLALVRVDVGLMLSFLLGSGLLIVGMGLFTLGAELSMSRIGNLIGAKMTKSQKLWFVLGVSFLLGVAITMAEPDLQVLATNVPAIDKTVLVVTVSVGVGFFLMLCMARILFSISLRLLLIIFYAIVFIGAFLSDAGFLSVAFDRRRDDGADDGAVYHGARRGRCVYPKRRKREGGQLRPRRPVLDRAGAGSHAAWRDLPHGHAGGRFDDHRRL